MLQLVHAAAPADAEEIVDEDADRLRVIDARLGRDDEHPDLFRIDVRRAEEPCPRRRRERHDVLAGRRDRHLAHTEARGELLGGYVPRRGEVRQAERVLRDVDGEPFDADAHSVLPPIRIQRPSAMSGK